MEQNPHYIAFVNAIAQVLAQRENANVMVLIEGQNGVEIHTSVPSVLWAFGILRAADEIIKSKNRVALDGELIRQKEEQMQAEFQAAIESAKGSVN